MINNMEFSVEGPLLVEGEKDEGDAMVDGDGAYVLVHGGVGGDVCEGVEGD